jgi:hypothetical protein
MVNEKEIIDRMHLQKYIFLIGSFLQKKIDVASFEKIFLKVRHEDSYWMSGLFEEKTNRTLDSIFLDIDEFNPDELYDPSDVFNINESELRDRLTNKMFLLES